jgi:Fic family protein
VDIDRFGPEASGQLIPISGTDGRTGHSYEHWAFLPDPLPERVALSDECHVMISRSSAALARLDAISARIPNPALFRRPAIRREAQSTSALEGTYAPLEAVLGAETDAETSDDAIREVLNYVQAAELGFSLLAENPISMWMLNQLQYTLVKSTAIETPDSGQPRSTQVMIGSEGGTIESARYVPPPPDDRLKIRLDDWQDWIQRDHPALAPVTQAAMTHYQFEALHPYSDGNGRIGRLIIVLQLCQLGAINDRLLTVSPWLERRRREYQDHMLAVSHTGDWEPWIRFFSTAVQVQAEKTADQIAQLLDYQDQIKEIVRSRKWSGTIERIAEELIGFPVFDVQSLADRHEIGFATANRIVGRLEQAGIVQEVTGRSYGRTFVAHEVYRILSTTA